MRDALIIFISLIAAIVIGGSLYLFGGPGFHISSFTHTVSGSAIQTLAEGTNALSMDTRVNYRITNQADLVTLWGMIYSSGGPGVPTIDFSTQEVIAVFDGSHSTGGYSIHVSNVKDVGGKREIHIIRSVPDVGCATTNDITSPFDIVALPKSSLSLTHVDETATSSCGS